MALFSGLPDSPMKISRSRKNQRRKFALQPTCPNCGEEGRHALPRTLEDVIAGRQWFACERKHRRMATTIETSAGPIEATITGDPDMPPETRKALTEMMRLCAEHAMSEAALNPENDQAISRHE